VTSKVVVALRVKATPERAFRVFTEEVGLWWRPNGLFQFTPRSPGVVSFEPGPDGRFLETLPSGKVFEVGKVRAWEPPADGGPGRLVFGWRQATFASGQDTEVEVRFEPVGEETRVTVEHRGWDTVPQEHVARHHFPDQLFLLRHAEWWRSLLIGLQERTP
jgi:hypothetical protein